MACKNRVPRRARKRASTYNPEIEHNMSEKQPIARRRKGDMLRPLPRWIFMSRWLQAPLYIGLIVAQALYVWQFWRELAHLIQEMTVNNLTEAQVMLITLGLIDVVMISNLGSLGITVGNFRLFV